MTKLFNGNHLDLYSINSDFTGSRYFTIDQEEVEFHNATTIRIWFNEQSADFPSHWHTAMEILMPVEITTMSSLTTAAITCCLVKF